MVQCEEVLKNRPESGGFESGTNLVLRAWGAGQASLAARVVTREVFDEVT